MAEYMRSKCIGGLGPKNSNGGTQYYQQDRVYSMGDIALALPAQIPGGSYNYMEIKVIGRMDHTIDHTLESANRVYGKGGCCPTIPTGTGGGHMPKVMDVVYIRQATKSGVIPCKIGGVADLNYPTSKTRRGRVIDMGDTSPTLTTTSVPDVLEDWIWEVDGVKYKIRIRKLTPKECFRLMDFRDEDYYKAQKVNSNTQLYKQAGNSIVKSCLSAIFKELIP